MEPVRALHFEPALILKNPLNKDIRVRAILRRTRAFKSSMHVQSAPINICDCIGRIRRIS